MLWILTTTPPPLMHPYSEQVEVGALLLLNQLRESGIRSQLQESGTRSQLRQASGTLCQVRQVAGIRVRRLQPARRHRRRRPRRPPPSPVPTPNRHLRPGHTAGRQLLPAGPLVIVVAAEKVPEPCRLRLLFAHPVTTCGSAWWGSMPIKGFQGVFGVFTTGIFRICSGGYSVTKSD